MASRMVKYSSDEYEISYEVVNPKCKKIVLFLHGWGANKEIMKKAFGSYLSDFCHVYVDMPGFGKSSILDPLKTSDYAKIVANFCDELKIKPDIIVGHSFGGKVATLLKSKFLVLLSSAGIVVKKSFSVRAKIATFKIFKLFGFGKFYKLFATKDVSGMSRVMYETLKNVVDEDFTKHFADFDGRVLVFWGENDKATPVKSGETIHKLIKNSSFFPLGGDHFFFLLHAKFISEEIEKGINFEPNEAKNVVLDDDESGIEEIR
ncbi:alpha/beta fold hydrolase [Campylobacter concisus]|uniref:alpha/beta fold hydrolase n=1 Tax=Campylobacter concisus TaxID=199 RepID=UPI00122C3CA2|nr:alpha/beta hydrolase [Campylobacter concisus]